MEFRLKLKDNKLFYIDKYIGKCYPEVDGYYVYEPDSTPGQFNEHSLRLIANFLEKLNESWNDQVKKELSKYIEDDEGDDEAW